MEVKFIKSKLLIACIFLALMVLISAVGAGDADNTALNSNDVNLTVQSNSVKETPILDSSDDYSNEELSSEISDDSSILSTSENDGGTLDSSDGSNDEDSTVLANSNGEDVLGDDPGTFYNLRTDFNSQKSTKYVSLDRNYTSTSSSTPVYIYSYDSNLVIDGNGHTLDGNGRTSVFYLNAANNVTFKNIKFVNGYSTNGGAIYGSYNSDNVGYVLNFINCTFENCKATTGGVMYFGSINGDINIINCSFNNNYATSSAGVFNFQNSLQPGTYAYIINSSFNNNRAPVAGVVYAYRGVHTNIESSNFTNNSASSEAGVIRYSEEVYITASKFENNYCTGDGGCFYAGQVVPIYMYDSEFINNSAKRWGGVAQARSIIADNTKFINNFVNVSAYAVGGSKTATARGGALFSMGGTVSISNSQFINNLAQEGAAICLEERASSLSVSNSNFTNNNATVNGGAIFSVSTGLNGVSSSNFENNVAKNGGAIYLSYVSSSNAGSGSISICDFKYNNATDNGGAIYVDMPSTEVNGATFSYNHATLGGAIYWNGNAGKVARSTFISNSASNGTSLYWLGTNGEVSNSAFKESNPGLGVIYLEGTGEKLNYNDFDGSNAVYIAKQASATLSSNNQYSSNLANYSIYNQGTATFSSNKFYNYILNNGTILSQTQVITLDNVTKVTDKSSVEAYVKVIDDNGNFIKLNNTISIVYLSKMVNATFNNTCYVASVNNLSIGYTRFGSRGYNNSGLSDFVVKDGGILYLLINLTVNITNYGEKVDFTTTVVNTTYNGTIKLDINDVSYIIPLVNGTAVLTLYNMAPNKYDVTASYMDYNQTVSANITIDIELRNSTIIVTATNITYGNNVTININTTNSSTGNVLVIVNNKIYTVKLVNSTAQLIIPNLPGGNYTVYAVYNGDSSFYGSHNSTNFTVSKFNTTMIINATDVLVGQPVTINVLAPSDIKGKIYVYVDDKEYVFNTNHISFTVSNLTAGNHTVRAIYGGDEKYLAGNNTTTCNVNKKNITMTMNTVNIKVTQNETITINLPSDAGGLLLVNVNGTTYSVYANNTKAILVLNGLKYGDYNVNVTYLEDELYNQKSIQGSFKVERLDVNPNITYEVNDDLIVQLNATVPKDVTGAVIIEVAGKNYTAFLSNGLARAFIPDLEGGEYPAKLYLVNDSKYKDTIKDFVIKLEKIPAEMHINAPAIYVDENATITVNVPRDATGNITININNKTYTTNVINGTAVFTVTNLTFGNYEFVANYTGNKKYLSTVKDAVLVVNKIDPSPYSYINATSIFVGENATINITMPYDATGKVNLTIQNNVYEVNIDKGHGQINISGLKYGVPVPIHAEYSGDDKYLPCERQYTAFSVHRISNYHIDINDTIIDNIANITVHIPVDANGSGYINISNGTHVVLNQAVNYINGVANITGFTLTPGSTYVVYAYFDGNEKYTANDAYKTLNSNKTLNYTFEISAADILVGQTAILKIYLPNATVGDNITISVPNRTAVTIQVTGNTTEYPIYNLTAGSHRISVTYLGNDVYDASSRYGNISVSKINYYIIRVGVNTPYVNQNITFNITLPTDANGNITVKINNTEYPAVVVNGTAYVVAKGLPAGTYNATVYYDGDAKYNNRTQYVSVVVLKIEEYDFTMNVSDILVNETETIYVYLPTDVNGNVTITIVNTTYVDKIISIVNGVGSFNATGLAPGRYEVIATLTNDTNYESDSVLRYFTVSTISDYKFNLTYNATVLVRDNITFILELPNDANGFVNLTIFNKTQLIEVIDGIASINVTAKKDGVFSFAISFYQEGKYDYKSQTGYVVVSKVNPNFNPIYKANVNVGENVTFTVILPSDATGNISIITRGITYTAKLINGSANITILGYPLASIYSPTVSYTGDDKYYDAALTTKINVTKINDYDLNVTVSNITVDDDEIVNITLPKDATDDVLISGNFSTETYSRLINNGNVSFVISDLPAGTYNITVRYQGYNKYEEKSVTKIFTVRKVVPPIEIDFVNNDTVIVKLPTNANGNATIVIKNNESVIKINTQINIINGVGSLNISGLRPGNYTVNATFLGGVRYLQNSTTRNISIPKIKDYILPISVNNITVYENATILITLPENATGFVNITINDGSIIQVPIIGGIATYNASGLKVGNYTVKANYSNVEYDFKSNLTMFEVAKIRPIITNIIIGNATELTINTTLTDGVTGNLTITVGEKQYNFTNIDSNKINLTVPIIPGVYTITTVYSGDENHTGATKEDHISISKITDYTMTVNTTQLITVFDNNVINVTLPKGINGTVHIYLNGELYGNVKINETTGIATLTLPRIASGNYTVLATFSNDIYDYKENTTNFTVIKLNTTISVDVANITKDLSELINITVNETISGSVLIDMNGTVYYGDIISGNGSLILSNLEEGNYTVTVTFLGDEYFNSNTTTVNFTVSKIPVDIKINTTDIVVGHEAHFDIVASRNITSLVTVKIGNNNYTTFLSKGKGSLIVTNLTEGYYNVTVIYDGDVDYLSATNVTNINVTGKSPTKVIVNVTNITVGETVTIYVNVTGADSGNVAIAMLGDPIIKQLVGGTANFTYSNLTARNYHFTAYYIENDLYLGSNATGDFTVFKKDAPISASVSNATVGSVEYINVTLPINATGTVLLTVNGTNYYGIVKDGVAKFNVTGLLVGNYTAYITYEGDSNYLDNSTEVNITTTKRDLTITIVSDNVTVVGYPVVFNITTSANITEVITIRIGNNNYTSFVENGKGVFTVYNLVSGNYTAFVYFPGNSQYDAADNFTKFNVSGKAPTSLNVTVNNITLGEDAVIYVNVTGASTGKVTLNLAGNPQTKDVVDGKVNFTVSGLSARDYHLTVTYIENDNYLSSNATADFTVFKKNSTVTVNVSNIFVGEVEIINITVSENATGHVLITLANINLYANINGSAVITVPVADLPIGEYNVTVEYVGDNNYYGSSCNGSFNITKLITSIVIDCNETIVVG